MTSATKLLKASGSVPVGMLTPLPPNLPNQVDWPDGKKFLKSGVIAKGSDFPDVPSLHLKQMSPLVKVGDIGSGGSWRCLTLDSAGYPLVASQISADSSSLVRITGLSSTSNLDTTTITNGCSNASPGSFTNRIVFSNNSLFVGYDWSKSAYSAGAIRFFSLAPFVTTTTSQVPGGGASTSSRMYAMNANPNTKTVITINYGASGSDRYNLGISSVSSNPSLPSVANWIACCAGSGNNWVAIASGSTTAASSSDDAVSWTARTLPSSASWVDVCWNGTVYCAVASGGTAAATSTDGATWTARTLPSSQLWTAVAAHPVSGMLIAVASGTNVYATSTDSGVNWTQRTFPATAAWENVIYSPALSRWVAVASDGRAGVVTSPDGITWTTKAMPRPLGFNKLESFGGNLYAMSAARKGVMTNPVIAKSTDNGATWTYFGPRYNIGVGNTTSNIGTALKFLNGKFTLADINNSTTLNIWTSTDLVTWTLNSATLSGLTSAYIGDITYGGGKYVVVLESDYNGVDTYVNTNRAFYSTNMTTWTGTTLPRSAKWTSVLHTGSRFVALGGPSNLGSYDILVSSSDGITWTDNASALSLLNQGAIGNGSLSYDPVRNQVFAYSYYQPTPYSFCAVSSDHGLTWTWTPQFAQFCVPSGSRYVAISRQTGVSWTSNDVTGSDIYNSFSTGVADISHNQNITYVTYGGATYGGNVYAAATLHSSNYYFLNPNSVYTVDSSDWIDNRTPSTVGTSNFYMRVK